MAGSWNHMVVTEPSDPEDESTYTTDDIGKPYRDRHGSFGLVENMGDAVEAMEECYGMVWWLAGRLGANREEIMAAIEDARLHYREGYQAGAGVPPRW